MRFEEGMAELDTQAKGARPVTIKDIAREAGVSTATVSYVINDTKPVMPEKRQRILDVIEAMDYHPNRFAKSLRTKKTNTIGVLAEDILAFPTSRIVGGISEYMEQTDYQILLSDLRMLDSLYNRYDQIVHQKEKINKAVSFLASATKVDAIIYIGMFDRDITGIIANVNKPVVIAYSTSGDSHTWSVTYENEAISTLLTRHLIECGHERIAVITGIAHTAPAQTRLKGIQKAFSEAGRVLDSALVKNGDWERGSGYACMKELLGQGKDRLPTAVLAMNDFMAIGAMDAIREAGLSVPGDISVAGFDNREVSDYVLPKLTTVEIDLNAIGFAAARVAVQKPGGPGGTGGPGGADEDGEGRCVVIPSKLIVRDTVARIAKIPTN